MADRLWLTVIIDFFSTRIIYSRNWLLLWCDCIRRVLGWVCQVYGLEYIAATVTFIDSLAFALFACINEKDIGWWNGKHARTLWKHVCEIFVDNIFLML